MIKSIIFLTVLVVVTALAVYVFISKTIFAEKAWRDKKTGKLMVMMNPDDPTSVERAVKSVKSLEHKRNKK